MEGVIRYIRPWRGRSSLMDENRTDRMFDHGQLTDVRIKEHDAVTFTLDGTTVVNITLLKKHKEGIVFSW